MYIYICCNSVWREFYLNYWMGGILVENLVYVFYIENIN